MGPVLSSLVLALAALGAAAATGASGSTGSGRADGYFAVACGFSHRNQDDPIVHPGHPGRSHDHTYFGNTSTNANSTPASLRRAGRTTCRIPADTAAYWAPTLFRDGRVVEPLGAVVVYARRTSNAVDPFPRGLRMVAGNATARTAQSRRVTNWSCGFKGGVQTSTVPDCGIGKEAILRLEVNFPDCWDGSRLDSPDHKSHMAYSEDGECPISHPVELPGISLLVYYPVSDGDDVELASGGQLSGHADFVNAWHQRTLAALVERYLNQPGFGGKGP
jgi:hypothetical protein